jgi:hypothetical protein
MHRVGDYVHSIERERRGHRIPARSTTPWLDPMPADPE